MNRSCGRSGLSASAASGQAPTHDRHSVHLAGVDDNRAERRARLRQRDLVGCGRRLREQMVDRQIERRALVGLHAEARRRRTAAAGATRNAASSAATSRRIDKPHVVAAVAQPRQDRVRQRRLLRQRHAVLGRLFVGEQHQTWLAP